MKISLNWISDYIDITPIQQNLKEVLSKLTMRGLEVEGVQDLAQGFDKVIVAQIETREKHPNADRLSVCKVNTGREVLQIVCGAQNMKAGDKVALSQIGAKLPNGVSIEKGSIRGVESFGMLCSEVELGLSESSEGILILPLASKVGDPLATTLGRNDIILEINVTPNRGDALSHLGVARELASILNQKLKHTKVEMPSHSLSNTDIKKLIKLEVSEPKLCFQYHGRVIEDVKVKESPDWLKKRLLSIGLRPINNVVDITNFILMDLGTPLHAFDYDKIEGQKVQVRLAKTGEKILLLDQSTVTLSDSDLVIADEKKPVALAGVMGGAGSQVDLMTSKLFLEAAQFDPSTVRKTAKRHQKSSDSSYRFERQIDPNAVWIASERAASLICEIAGGRATKSIKVESSVDVKNKKQISISSLNSFLGTSLTNDQVRESFNAVGFECQFKSTTDDLITVVIPSYRPDVEIIQDLYEEVLRVYGYNQIISTVPQLRFLPDPLSFTDQRFDLIQKLKVSFVIQGLSEAINLGFTSRAQQAVWGGPNRDLFIELANPLNEEFSIMKTSLLGGLAQNLKTALHHQTSDVRLFEIRPCFKKIQGKTEVHETWLVTGVCTGRSFLDSLKAHDRAFNFYDLKGVLETVFDSIGVRGVRYQEPKNPDMRVHPGQASEIVVGPDSVGFFGRLHPSLQQEFKTNEAIYVFEFQLDPVLKFVKSDKKFSAISKFPTVPRDFSLLVPNEMTADKIIQLIQKLSKPRLEKLEVVDIYRGDKIPHGMYSLSVSMVFSDPNMTLDESIIEAMSQSILAGLDKDLGVKIRVQ